MKTPVSCLLAIIAVAAAGQAWAADVGRVLLAAGDTVAVRDKQVVKLVFGSTIQDRDVLRTGPASSLQLRFTDESILSMRENSEVRIDEFRFTGREDGSERAFFSLLKGGLRKITGIIGRINNKNYQMSTAVATIGIRGTHYLATICQQDCRNPDGTLAKDGLYGLPLAASSTSKNSVTNATGEHIFGIGQPYYAQDFDTRPQLLREPPGLLSVAVKGKSTKPPTGTGTEQAAAGGTQQDARGTPPPPPSVVLPRLLTGSSVTDSFLDSVTAATGPASATVPSVAPTIGAIAAFVDFFGFASDEGAYVTPSMLTLSGTGSAAILTGFNISGGTEVGPGEPPFSTSATGTLAGMVVDTGFGSSVNANWGRWTGGILIDEDGTFSLGRGGFHYMKGDLAPPDVGAAKTGTFSLFQVGGTTPTNSLGETANSSSTYPSMTINFTSRVASLGAFGWFFPTNSWVFPAGSANVVIKPQGAGIDGVYTGGSCTGGSCSTAIPVTLGVTGIFYGMRGDHLGAAFSANAASERAMGVRLYSCAPSC